MSLPEVRREAADYEAHPAETLDELKTREDSNSLEFHIYVDHSTPTLEISHSRSLRIASMLI
jgi:hypothetical protein